MDTNTVVEPLDETSSDDEPVVVVEAADPTAPLGADGSAGGSAGGSPDASPDGSGAGRADPREALLARSALWDTALATRDEALARQVLHPGFALELVQPVRSVTGHALWLEVLADYVVHEWEVEDQVVDLDGDYAALLQRVRMRATVMGEDRSGIFVLSDLWRCVDGQWVVWRRHSTPLLAGGLPLSGDPA